MDKFEKQEMKKIRPIKKKMVQSINQANYDKGIKQK